MWKSIISTGQKATQATQATRKLPITPSRPTRAPFSTNPTNRKGESHNLLDRESLNPQRTETSKSGTDSEVAEHPSAFDPQNTSPEGEHEAASKESKREGKEDPLNMSPANKDVSAWRGATEGGPDRNREQNASSSRGTPKKSRGIQVKEDGTHVSYRD